MGLSVLLSLFDLPCAQFCHIEPSFSWWAMRIFWNKSIRFRLPLNVTQDCVCVYVWDCGGYIVSSMLKLKHTTQSVGEKFVEFDCRLRNQCDLCVSSFFIIFITWCRALKVDFVLIMSQFLCYSASSDCSCIAFDVHCTSICLFCYDIENLV